MHKLSLLLFPFTVLFTVLQCSGPLLENFDEPQKFVSVKNVSNDSIIVQLSYSYPDTICPSFGQVLEGCSCPPMQQEDVLIDEDPNVLMTRCPVMQVFVFKASVVKDFFKTHRLSDPIGQYHLEQKRYELTREWFEAHNWTITYP